MDMCTEYFRNVAYEENNRNIPFIYTAEEGEIRPS